MSRRMSFLRGGYFACLLCLIFASWMCSSRVDEADIVASVGNTILTREAMSKMMSWEGMNPEQETEFIDRWVNRELLFQEAKRLGMDKSEDLSLELDLVEKEHLIQKLMDRTFAEKIRISDEEIGSYYESHREEFTVSEDEVRVLHILTKTEADANAARQEIMAGKPFEDVARERSVGIFQESGGDLGFFKSGEVIPEIERYAFRLSEGEVSRVFQSSYGFHILKIVKKYPKDSVKDLVAVREEILQHLRVTKERSIYYDFLYQLQNRTKVYVSVPRGRGAERDTLTVPAVPEGL